MRRTTALLLFLTATAATAAPPSQRLQDLFAREWEYRLAEDPLLATSVGRHEWDHLLPAAAPADHRRRAESWREFLLQLEAIDIEGLDERDRVSYQIFRRQLEDRIAEVELGGYQMPLNADSGFHTDLAQLPEEVPLASAADYDAYLARLRAFPEHFADQIESMRLGIERGMVLPAVVLNGYEVTIESHLVADPRQSLFYTPFEAIPASLPPSEQERLRREGEAAVVGAVIPAYRRFAEFMAQEYLPAARPTLAATLLPEGRRYYAQQVRHFTTLDLSPDEIHDIGLREVARIRAEMEGVINGLGFDGSFADFLERLRSDPRFYAVTPEELLKEAAFIAKRMDGKLPALFKTLPRLPYGIEPVPDHLAPKYTAGRYVPAPVGGTRPGLYWVNTYALDSRPLYNLEALTLHEAVPGHHLQLALSQELQDLPAFRRYSYISAFGEGWGLYAERLGLETGFYQDPYSDFGRLGYEMWRACRLVVDTGIHALGWSRRRAMDYLASHTALPLHEVETEIDRYISWPGQALAYKLGELEIRRLRQTAEEALGPGFDVREFHDAVLGSGAVPLPVLAQQIERFIRDAKEKG